MNQPNSELRYDLPPPSSSPQELESDTQRYILHLARIVFPDRKLSSLVLMRIHNLYIGCLNAQTKEEVDLLIKQAQHDPSIIEGDQSYKDIDQFANYLIHTGLASSLSVRQPRLSLESSSPISALSHAAMHTVSAEDPLNEIFAQPSDSSKPVIFPWIFQKTVDGKTPSPKINPEFFKQASKELIDQVYGTMRGEADLSPFGRMYFENIRDAFKRFKADMVKADGGFPEEGTNILGQTVEEYLIQAEAELDDPREIAFLNDQVEQEYGRIGAVWKKVVDPAVDNEGITEPRHRARKHWS